MRLRPAALSRRTSLAGARAPGGHRGGLGPPRWFVPRGDCSYVPVRGVPSRFPWPSTSVAALTLRSLEDHLWASADLFRGLTDVEVQRDYVLALLFFKRASDQHREETAAAIEELGGVDDGEAIIAANPDAYHSLRIPDGEFWDDVIAADRTSSAPRSTTRCAPSRPRTHASSPASSTTPTSTTARRYRRTTSPTSSRHFNGARTVDSASACRRTCSAQAYEWLIAKFAAEAGKAGGEFYTPAPVGKLGARILAPPAPARRATTRRAVPAGCCFSCATRPTGVHGEEARALTSLARSSNRRPGRIGRMNMLLHGASGAATIEQGDTLFSPAFLEDGASAGSTSSSRTRHSRPRTGATRSSSWRGPVRRIKHLPPKRHGEMAFVQHMVASLADGGRMAVVLPNGALFRARQRAGRSRVTSSRQTSLRRSSSCRRTCSMAPAFQPVISFSTVPSAQRAGAMSCSSTVPSSFERVDTKNVMREDDSSASSQLSRTSERRRGLLGLGDQRRISLPRFNLTVRRYVIGRGDDSELSSLSEAIAELRAARREDAGGRRGSRDVSLAALGGDMSTAERWRTVALGDVLEPVKRPVAARARLSTRPLAFGGTATARSRSRRSPAQASPRRR